MTKAEQKFMFYKNGMEGSFFTALFDAMEKADHVNLNRLKSAFPDEAYVVERYRDEHGYFQKLEREFNGLTNS